MQLRGEWLAAPRSPVSNPEAEPDLRCAAQLHLAGADPVGTAGTQRGYLLVEWPRPWPHDLAEVPELAPVRAALSGPVGAGIRLQGLVPERADSRRVILYRWAGSGPFAGYGRSEAVVRLSARLERDGAAPPADPVAVGSALAAAARDLLAGPTPPPGGDRDVLVCTHGRRDRCCGSWGTQLWQQLDADPGMLGPGVRRWRTSHTGGHRYAATMIVLGEGTVWGFVDEATAAAAIRRDGPVSAVLGSYRGCAGLPSPAVQALERAVLAEVGWAVLSTPRTGEDLPGGRARLVLDPAGRAEAWEAAVSPGRTLPVPECGEPLERAVKTTTELVIADLTRAS